MLKDLGHRFSDLEQKIVQLKNDYQQLKFDYEQLLDNHGLLKHELDEEKKAHQELIEECKDIKLVSAISGNPNYNRLMKNHINRLIKEIEACIAQLQNRDL